MNKRLLDSLLLMLSPGWIKRIARLEHAVGFGEDRFWKITAKVGERCCPVCGELVVCSRCVLTRWCYQARIRIEWFRQNESWGFLCALLDGTNK